MSNSHSSYGALERGVSGGRGVEEGAREGQSSDEVGGVINKKSTINKI